MLLLCCTPYVALQYQLLRQHSALSTPSGVLSSWYWYWFVTELLLRCCWSVDLKCWCVLGSCPVSSQRCILSQHYGIHTMGPILTRFCGASSIISPEPLPAVTADAVFFCNGQIMMIRLSRQTGGRSDIATIVLLSSNQFIARRRRDFSFL